MTNTSCSRQARFSAIEIPGARLRLFGVCGCLVSGQSFAATGARALPLQSPDGKIEADVHTRGSLTYGLAVDGHRVLNESRLGLQFCEGTELGSDVEMVNAFLPCDSPGRVRRNGREPSRLSESGSALNSATPCDLAHTINLKMAPAGGAAARFQRV